MCLLAVLYKMHPDAPLIVAANRDELLGRPATPMTVLRESDPRILGGRDERAGGTWLAVNERGVFAGLTNRPGASDPAKRSRGELPLLLARGNSAQETAHVFSRTTRPADYSAAWLLTGDREHLYYIDLTIDADGAEVRALPPGLHVLENAPLESRTAKVNLVQDSLRDAASLSLEALEKRLRALLANHEVADGAADPKRPDALRSPCVHAGVYGTRSSEILVMKDDEQPPRISFTGGPPCTNPWQDATALWAERRRS